VSGAFAYLMASGLIRCPAGKQRSLRLLANPVHVEVMETAESGQPL